MQTQSAAVDPDVYVPKFKSSLTSADGRAYGVKKVPQTSFVEITAEGKGDIPKALKGRFTSTGLAEKAVKAHLDIENKALLARESQADILADIPPEPVPVVEVEKEKRETLSLKK